MTWDTLDTQPYCLSAGMSISGGVTVTATSTNFYEYHHCLAMPFEGKTSGKWYIEITCVTAGNPDPGQTYHYGDAIGICGAGAIFGIFTGGFTSATDFIGGAAGTAFGSQSGIGMSQIGDINQGRIQLVGQNPLVAWGATGSWGSGDRWGLAIDLDNHSIWWRRNGGAWLGTTNTGSPSSNTGGITIQNMGLNTRYFPAASFAYPGQYTFNFGASSFVDAVPTGFTAGWTNTGLLNFGSYLSNGIGVHPATSTPLVLVSPYVSSVTGTVSQLRGVVNNSETSPHLGVIYAADGPGGGPGTLLSSSTNAGTSANSTEAVYPLITPVSVRSGIVYHLGKIVSIGNGLFQDVQLTGGGSNGLYVDTTAVWPTPNATFVNNLSSGYNQYHIPMLAELSSGAHAPPSTGKITSQAHIFGR